VEERTIKSISKELIVQQIQASLEELNLQLVPDHQIPVSANAKLLAPDGLLDSMGMAILIACLEDRIGQLTGRDVVISNEGNATILGQAFYSVQTLAEYVGTCIEGRSLPDDEE